MGSQKNSKHENDEAKIGHLDASNSDTSPRQAKSFLQFRASNMESMIGIDGRKARVFHLA